MADAHGDEPDVAEICHTLARFNDRHLAALPPLMERYAARRSEEPERLHTEPPQGSRGGLGLLRDLQELHTLASLAELTWTVVGQAGRALRDEELVATVESAQHDLTRQLRWLVTRVKQAAPQALVAAS
ncbi:hypothetical protein ORV05_08430 [Amycolatopsis cynarae]|uniref:Uncharacterized protein n=1 Tax=Amycolatopsis cynarae TaxID=2995223 RepID=A0ABY7B764_9PSEU|nr:hypothetical protein [Amycolatopsis sp. HUAS 11-8]WAL67784.1 hypothetical protein ORV05_08430 [Amycolatopsis sp. HUAS 11-8]